MNFSDRPNSPKSVTFFNQHNSSFGRHVNATSRKNLQIQAYSITNSRTHSKQKNLYEY